MNILLQSEPLFNRESTHSAWGCEPLFNSSMGSLVAVAAPAAEDTELFVVKGSVH